MIRLNRRTFLRAGGVAMLAIPIAHQVAPAPPVFRVRDFGAVSDGTGDDTAAVLAATRAAHAAGGGVVEFGAGATVMGDLGEWSSGIVYRGSGSTSILRIPDGRTFRIGASRVAFEDLTFERAHGGFMRVSGARFRLTRCTFHETATDGTEGVVLDPGADGAHVDQCVFRGLRAVSVFIDSCRDVKVRHSRIVRQRYAAGYMACIQLVGDVRRIEVSDNVVSADPACVTPLNGIGLAGTGLVIARNRFTVSRFAIEGGDRVTGRIEDNRTAVSSTPVVDGPNYAAGISLPKTHRTVVVGNTIDQRGGTRSIYAGIELPDSSHCIVRHNRLIGSRSVSLGIMLDSATDCVIDRNTIIDYQDGIVVYGHGKAASRNRITKNRVRFTGAERHAGISVLLDATGSANDNAITENVVHGLGAGVGINVDVQVGTGELRRTVVARNAVSNCAVRLSERTGPVIAPGGSVLH